MTCAPGILEFRRSDNGMQRAKETPAWRAKTSASDGDRERRPTNGAPAADQHPRLSHPTILVASSNDELRQRLASSLRADNCLVLDVDSLNGMLDAVIVHSRPIHVLMLDVGLGRNMIGHLKRYRSGMHVVLMDDTHEAGMEDALAADAALSRARLLVGIVKRAFHA
jgi:hypothetical protein